MNKDDELKEIIEGKSLVNHEGHWYPPTLIPKVTSIREKFKAQNTDIIVASFPKSGTTWLKALTFSIANRRVYSIDKSPFLTSIPHMVVPTFEFDFDWNQEDLDIDKMSSPRILATHLPYNILPISILESDCKILYICRNPLDNFISYHFFLAKLATDKSLPPPELDDMFNSFCEGKSLLGPFWDHILQFWNAHLKDPWKVLFLTYEDLKQDTAFNVKKIAEFIGCPFSLEEDENGSVEEIVNLCSFNTLSNMEINKTGLCVARNFTTKNDSYFRKGKVGDWTNYLTPAMAQRLKKVVEMGLEGSGLTFKMDVQDS